MPVAKKERPNHKCWWQTKNERLVLRLQQEAVSALGPYKWNKSLVKQAGLCALLRQANSWHQMKERKQLKPPQNPKRLPTCKHKVGKNNDNKTPPNHKSLSNRVLSATKEWTTTVIRAQSKNNGANDKQMES